MGDAAFDEADFEEVRAFEDAAFEEADVDAEDFDAAFDEVDFEEADAELVFGCAADFEDEDLEEAFEEEADFEESDVFDEEADFEEPTFDEAAELTFDVEANADDAEAPEEVAYDAGGASDPASTNVKTVRTSRHATAIEARNCPLSIRWLSRAVPTTLPFSVCFR